MGIRFFCPQGHRLHVKSFLAGKRGVCPDCGMSVEIPMESDARAVSRKKLGAAGKADDDEPADMPVSTAVLERPADDGADREQNDFALPASLLPPAAAAPVPAAVSTTKPAAVAVPAPTPVVVPVLPSPAPVAAVSIAPVVPTPAAVTPSIVPTPAVVPAVAPAPVPQAVDVLTEAPLAVWYVRPPAGGQYGPAKADVMRKWMGEGRVTPDSLVWREGWPDWRSASKVFPTLGGSSGGSAGEAALPIVDTPRRPIRPARKPSAATGIGIVVGLGLVCVGLFVALLYVLTHTGTPTP
jgi:hypothetical protein